MSESRDERSGDKLLGSKPKGSEEKSLRPTGGDGVVKPGPPPPGTGAASQPTTQGKEQS